MQEEAGDKRKYYPLTHAQKRIYYDEKLHPGTSISTQAFIVRYNKILDWELMEQAISNVILKNDGFRLRIVELDYEPRQYVTEYTEHSFDYKEFSGADSEQRMREWAEETTRVPLDMSEGAPFYFALIKFNEKQSGYYMKFHHAASDGGSYPIIFSEINRVYQDLEAGKSVDDAPNPSYLEYISDEEEYLNSEQVEKDKKFWHDTFLPLPQSLNLTPKKGDPSDLKGDMIVTTFPEEVRAMIDDYCKSNRTSIFKLIFTAVSIYAARVSGLEDVAITAVNHNRFHKDPGKRANRDKIVGMFVSTLPFRVEIKGDTHFDDLVKYIGNDTINYVLKKHQQYPYDRLATELRDVAGTEPGYLTDVLISAHGDVEKEDYIFEHIFQGYVPGSINMHINYNNKYQDGILEMEYEYRAAHYEPSEIEEFHRGLVTILGGALSNPTKKISEIQLLSPEEKEQILESFNKTESGYPGDKTIHQLFEAQVGKTPGAVAITSENGRLTCEELNTNVNRVAHALREKGVTIGTIVGLMIERSLEMYTGIMAILKAGGVYLPL
ncbi:MAG: AMP-binding protein, partial [bacterium]|nr:AMP-binding protein [bacterium]